MKTKKELNEIKKEAERQIYVERGITREGKVVIFEDSLPISEIKELFEEHGFVKLISIPENVTLHPEPFCVCIDDIVATMEVL